ncbi:CLUMA_CG013712, isoform A [Clunio marinus]|uniref:CLUMA_CG013712, isoform A n=1 Tax=Clunio marinus TaxID=568069 RepID=A0A1J1IPM3_9DIPT|nr:CLUMA_CG013712, isoform A [Clunio marinus]
MPSPPKKTEEKKLKNVHENFRRRHEAKRKREPYKLNKASKCVSSLHDIKLDTQQRLHDKHTKRTTEHTT